MYIEVKNNKKWKRSINGWIGGVCEGLAESFELNPNLVRVLWVLSIFIFGTGFVAYLVLWATLPREDELISYHQDKFFGVCKRISEQTGVELALIRLIAVVSAFASFGTTFILYFVLYFLLPQPKNRIHY